MACESHIGLARLPYQLFLSHPQSMLLRLFSDLPEVRRERGIMFIVLALLVLGFCRWPEGCSSKILWCFCKPNKTQRLVYLENKNPKHKLNKLSPARNVLTSVMAKLNRRARSSGHLKDEGC
uniref:Uncharacterized protein n=3 Tax=Nothobranchius TaxID=28779 RepID=A0A1A8B804_NOTFU